LRRLGGLIRLLVRLRRDFLLFLLLGNELYIDAIFGLCLWWRRQQRQQENRDKQDVQDDRQDKARPHLLIPFFRNLLHRSADGSRGKSNQKNMAHRFIRSLMADRSADFQIADIWYPTTRRERAIVEIELVRPRHDPQCRKNKPA